MQFKKVFVALIFTFGSLALIAPTPSKAGPFYNWCLSNLMGPKFSSFENLSSFCKCFQYVLDTEASPDIQEGLMANRRGEMPQELVKATFSVKGKCKAYIK